MPDEHRNRRERDGAAQSHDQCAAGHTWAREAGALRLYRCQVCGIEKLMKRRQDREWGGSVA